MAKKKSYHTIDELLEQQRQKAFSDFSVGDNKEYHTIDEIKKAATEQGLLTERAPATQPSAQTTSGRRNLMIRNNQIKNDSRQWKQNQVDGSNPFDLRNQVYKTQNETIPRIAQQAASDYVKNRMGYNYISQYGDDTRYSDVSNDINRVQQLKGGAARRGKDTEVYDRALDMLKGYSQRYRLDDTDASPEAVKDREDLYNDNKREISRLNSQLEAEKGGSLNQALRQWLDSYDDNGIITDEDNQYIIDNIKNDTGYDLSETLGGLDSAERQAKAEELRALVGQDDSQERKRIQDRIETLTAQNTAYERTQKKSDDYADLYRDKAKEEEKDPYGLLSGSLHTRNMVPKDYYESVEGKDNPLFTESGDLSQPMIKRFEDSPAASSAYKNIDAHTEMLTADEKEIYSYLLRNKSELEAKAYIDELKDTLQKRYNDSVAEYIDDANGVEKAILLASSVPMNVYGSVTGFAEDAINMATGGEIHPYSEAHAMYNIGQQTRSAVANDIDEATGGANVAGFSLGDAFQAAMSIPDFMLGSLTPEFYLASMSMGAAQSRAKELWEEGASYDQIVSESVLTGAAEAIFEEVSLDKIVKMAKGGSLKDYITTALKGMAIEGSEEVNTEIANILTDVIVRGSQSDWGKAIQKYIDEGYSEEEAKGLALGDMVKQVGYAGVGGMIGGAGGSAGVAFNKAAGLIQQKQERNQYIRNVGEDVTGAGNAQALLDRAAQIDDPAVKAQAQRTQQALDKATQNSTKSTNNRLSRETGKLYAAMQDSTAQGIQNAKANEIKAAIKSAYAAETGETDSSVISKAADAIYKSEYTDERLTRSERNLAETAAAQSALESVKNNPDLIESATQKAQERGFRDYVETAKLTQKQEQETKTDDDVDIAEFNYHEDDGKVYTSDGKKQVDIASVASIGDNDITFNLNDGQTESAKALDMPTNQAVLVQSILDLQKKIGVPLTADIANTLYQGYEQSDSPSVSAYMQDAQTVLFNGYANNTAPDSSINLPQGLRNQLYSMGRQLAASHTQAQQQNVNARVKGNKSRKGTVTFQDGINRNRLDPRRRAGVDAVEHLAHSLGFDVVFYRSTKDGKGRFSSEYVRKNKFVADGQQAPSGFWRGGKMYLDINAGMNGEGLILFTASHELVHMIREGSPEDFKALSDFLVKNYAEQGVDINDLVRKEMARSTNLTRDQALEEVIAESCETFLRDTTLNDKAQELYKQNPTLWSRIREALKRIVGAVKQWYSVARPQSEEARITMRAGVETLENAYDLWTKGIIKSADNLRNTEGEKSQNTRYTFAGREANNADVGTLEEAQQMEEEGTDSEDIRQQTGWFKGLDGLWRFELDDSQLRIKDTEPRYGRLYLHEAIDYPQLFEAYPRLESLVVSFKDMPEGERGSWDASRRTIEINNKLRQDEDALTETLIHELQHAVQRIEGFAKGASPQYWYNAFGLGEDNRTIAEKKEASSRRRQNESEYNETKQADPEFVERIERIDSTINSFVYDEATQEAWDKAQEDIKNLKEKYGEKKVNHFLYVVRSRRTAESTVGRMSKPFDLYQATAGEVEARDSASRRGYTAEQRRNIRPDVDREDVVFRPGDDANVKYQSRKDADYLSAVERGDMDMAQRMVDEAAKAAGYDVETYHGTDKYFNIFNEYAMRDLDYEAAEIGYHVGSKAAEQAYTQNGEQRNVMKLYTKLGNTIRTPDIFGFWYSLHDYACYSVGDYQEIYNRKELDNRIEYNRGSLKEYNKYELADRDKFKKNAEYYKMNEVANRLKEDINFGNIKRVSPDLVLEAIKAQRDYLRSIGIDALEYKNQYEDIGSTSYLLLDSSQAKSADPVTYDNDGDVIPLSERFNESNKDIRYQSRDDLFSTDDMFDDDSISSTVAREYITHHEDIGEVLKNIADIELPSSKVQSIVNRVIRNELGYLDEEARRTLSIELQLALERVSKTDAQDVSNEMINAVRKAVEGARITDERTQTSYQELRNVFKGKKYFLSDEQINQLKEHDMTFDDFRKAMFGKVTIIKRENAKRSINGGYADAQQLSLEGLHDLLDNPEEVLGIRRDEWDNKNYDAPYIIKNAFDTLREQQSQLVTDMYSDEAIDDMAIAIAAKITGDIVEAKYNSRKNPYVSKLVKDLQAKRTEAVNKQKERNKQKLAELKTKERERAEKREQDLKKKYQEQRDRNREGRKRTELRGKIRKLTDSLQRRLTAPKGKQYVPRELISQTVDVLNAVNLDSGRSTRLSEKLAALRNEYDKLKEREESYAMYDGVISNMLLGLSDSVGNTPIMNMTLSQLKQVYDVIRSMDYVIRESVKMTDTNFKKETHQIGRDWISEIKAVPKEHVGLLSGYVQTMLSAERFFNRIAGFKKNSTSSQLFDMLNKGQLAQTQYEMEFTQIFADLIQDKQLKSLYDTKNLVDIGLEDEDGNKVPITRGMMLSLYMHLLNEDNTRHVMGGGLTVPNMKDYYKGDVKKAFGNGMKSVRVGALDYSQYAEGIKSVIERQLTEYEIKWIEAAQEFFDVASRKALNETTMKLYGFRRANVNNYFPIHTDSNYRAPSFESITRDMSLENSGFMKERVKASNPIYLEDIVDVINDQISKVAKYCGMTLPIRNFQKVYGTTTHDFESSVQRELNRKFSASKKNAGATKYIDNLLTDLTSGRSTDDGFIARMMGRARGNLAQATLTLNPRVAIAQAASYPTAAAVIGWEPLFKALRKGGKNNTVFSRADREEIAEISPLLWKRTQGYSNVEIGDIKELRKQRHQVEGKLKKAMGWIEFFDGMTVGRLFYACQYYVDEQNPELKRGTAEYNAKVADVYNKVIERTQPNYTTLQRPDILRNPNALIKSLSMFMTQRLQNFNIVYDAVGTYNRYLKDYKKGLNGVTAEDVKGARTTLIRSVTSQLVAAGTIVGMKLLADVLLHSMNAYRDDDDELTAESVSLKLLDNFADTLFGSVLFGSDLYSLVKSAISGSRYYGISLSGVDSLVDAITNIVNLRKGITLDSANKAATSICQLFGIPLNNAEKIGKAIYYWASDISGGEAFESGVNRTIKQNLHRYETRLNSGEKDKANEIVTAMLDDKMSQGKTEKEAKSWLRGRFTATYKQRYIDAMNSNDTEEVKNIREILLSTGLYGSLSEQDKTLKKWLE